MAATTNMKGIYISGWLSGSYGYIKQRISKSY